VGDFCIYKGGGETSYWLVIRLPGQESACAIKLNKGEALGNRVWGWDGNFDKPTIMPSIHELEVWHGFLQNGHLKSC
jgi:hypothetical protein